MFCLRSLHAAILLFCLIVSISARPTPAGPGGAKRQPADPESEPIMRTKEGTADATAKSTLGNILVTRASNNQTIGYVNREFYNLAARRLGVTSTPALYLSASFSSGTPTEPANLAVQQSPDEYSLLGFVAGFSDSLTSGKADHVLLTLTAPTPPNSPPLVVGNSYIPSRTSESAVWKWNPEMSSLTASWVNTDGSRPSSVLWYLPLNNALMLISDPTAFSAQFPGGYQVNFALV